MTRPRGAINQYIIKKKPTQISSKLHGILDSSSFEMRL
jgi:hypothetical protein